MSISPYFPSRREKLNRLLNIKEEFDVFVASQTSNDSYHYIWDIPISGDAFWLEICTSPENTPLTGLARYLDWFNFEDPVLGTCSENIPEVLSDREQWIWLCQSENKGSCRHIPLLGRGVKGAEGLLPKNWMRFCPTGINFSDVCGNGYVLNDDAIVDDLRLVAIEISPKSGLNNNDIRNLWIALGQPYLEYSKDCHGWTILGLVNQQLPTINCEGIKIFTGGDFVDLSGLGAEGELIDITEEILSFHAYRFLCSKNNKTNHNPTPMTPREVARLQQMLSFISADCSYDTYIRVVWGIMSTGWSIAKQIALDWSLTAQHRFEQKMFDDLVSSYDISRTNTTTMGTIYHLARKGGWNG
jgi:hypothetical protein